MLIDRFQGNGVRIELYPEKLSIVTTIKTIGMPKQRDIYLKSISSIELKKPGLLAGYIQFHVSGMKTSAIRPDLSHPLYTNYRDANAIPFSGKGSYERAVAFVNKIDSVRNSVFPGVSKQEVTVSIADELLKFKQLKDEGVLSEEEFKYQKERILNKSSAPRIKMTPKDVEASIKHNASNEQLLSMHSKAKGELQTEQFCTDKMEAIHDVDLRRRNKTRKGMRAFAIFFFVLAFVYAMAALSEPFIVGMSVFSIIIGGMFIVLSKSPKRKSYIFGKNAGIKKTVFVIISVIAAFICVGVSTITLSETGTAKENTESSEGAGDITSDTMNASNATMMQTTIANLPTISPVEDQTETMEDVEQWYKEQMAFVSQSMFSAFSNVDGYSNLNIDSSKFRFGNNDGWYECHYTMIFTCEVNGDVCKGEARAFLPYKGNALEWFHLEIWRDSDWTTLVENYDDSYDAIIEAYYKELEGKYSSSL